MSNQETTLAILKAAKGTKTTQQNIANDIGYSVGKVNYVLKALIEKGLIKAERFINNENKKQYKYLLTQKGIEEKIELTEKFIDRKKKEYNDLQKELKDYKERYGYMGGVIR